MKSNLWRRLAALLATAGLAGSLLATVAAPAVVLAAVPGCSSFVSGVENPAGTCEVSGTEIVSGTITIGGNLHLTGTAHLDATASVTTPALKLNVTGNLTMDSGSIIEADDDAPPLVANADAKDLTINVTGTMAMAAGSRISADNNEGSGFGGEILITVDGDMSMAGTAGSDNCRTANAPAGLGFYDYLTFGFPNVYVTPTLGARISAVRWGASGGQSGGHIAITVGFYGVPPTGTFTMERCSIVDVSGKGPAGQIEITAGNKGNLDGLVLSESGQGGPGGFQPNGGGPINVRAGCELTVSDTGVVSSKGADPGADLVHLKGCEVFIYGVVQSTAPGAGHVIPTAGNLCNSDPVAHPLSGTAPTPAQGFTACVRILGQHVTIDGKDHNGNVNVDGIRSPMEAWIDIFTTKDIDILGKPDGTSTKWAVSGNSCESGPCSNSVGAVVTIKAKGGKVTTSGQAILQSNGFGAGSDGGVVIIEAGGSGTGTPAVPNPDSNVNLDGSFIEANGPAGSNTAGGTIKIRSYNGSISSGGDGSGHIQALGGGAVGVITLTECSNGDTYTGTVSPLATETRSTCGGGPILPADAQLLLDQNQPIWDACNPATKSGYKFHDLNGNGVWDQPAEPGLNDWTINVYNFDQSMLVDTTTTGPDALNNPGFYKFTLTPVAAGTTYVVCEQLPTPPPTWFQTFPVAGPGIVSCTNEGTLGYQITLHPGDNDPDNNFGNFQEAHKSGLKFNDQDDNKEFTVGEPGIPNWPINLYILPANTLDQTTNTDATGHYSFTITVASSYRVCEGVVGTFTQTFPHAGTIPPAGETLVNTCPAPNIWGYEFTVTSGANFTGNDYGNNSIFREIDKSGLKFDDANGNHQRDLGEGIIGNWPINLYGPGGTFPLAASTTTDPITGIYHFNITGPGPWRVCEGVGPAGYSQTFPVFGGVPPAGETIVNTCPGPNTVGYEFTAVSGVNLTADDFGNHKDVCKKPTAISIMNGAFPNNLGPDITVHTDQAGGVVQTAVDNVTDDPAGGGNGDGYLIIFVIAHADNSLGGTAAQNVIISKDYGNKMFGLIGCSVTLTGGGTGPAVWIQGSATAKPNPNLSGSPTILVADLHGGNSAIGVQADGSGRYLRNEAATGNGIGIQVNGNNNTVHNGAANGNSGDGVQVNGSNNVLTDTNSMGNGAHGFNVTGSGNQLLKLDAGEKNTPNTSDGVHVVGDSNKLSEIDAFKNGIWGINVIGNNNQLLKNVAGASNKGNGFGVAMRGGIRVSGSGNQLTENQANFNVGAGNTGIGFTISGGAGFNGNLLKKNTTSTNSGSEFIIGAGNTDQTGNKKNGTAFGFGAAGGTFN